MYVKPTHDHVPDIERGGYLPAEGRHVEATPYWLRRCLDGDVIETDPPRAGKQPAPARQPKGS